MNDVETIAGWLTEMFAMPEEGGDVSIIGLSYKQNGGTTELPLHAVSAKGGGPFGAGKERETAQLLWSIALRHASGLASPGGSHQFLLSLCRGTSPRPTRFLPFSVMGQVQVSPTDQSYAPTAQGVLAQSMALSEKLITGSFEQNKDTNATMATLIDRSMRRQAELENDNRELFTALKLVILEFQKSAHEMRMKELAAARAAAFQKKMMDLLPVLINMAGGDILPDSVEEQSIVDAIGSTYTQAEAEMFVSGLAAKPNGALVAAAVHRKLKKFYTRQAAEKEADERLMKEVPLRSFTEAAEDAAGRAVKVIRDQSASKQLDEGKANGHANGAKANGHANGTNGHAVDAAATVVVVEEGDAEKLRAMLFEAVPSEEQLGALTGMLRMRGQDALADEMEKQFREHQARKGEKQ